MGILHTMPKKFNSPLHEAPKVQHHTIFSSSLVPIKEIFRLSQQSLAGRVLSGASKVASGHGFLALVFLYAKKSERTFRAKFPRRGNFASPRSTLPARDIHELPKNLQHHLLPHVETAGDFFDLVDLYKIAGPYIIMPG